MISGTRYVLIVADPSDLHALAVKRQIEKLACEGVSALVIDAAKFPTEIGIRITSANWSLMLPGRRPISSDEVISVWWRRPQRHLISPEIVSASARKFAENESVHAFDTVVYWTGRYSVINRADKEAVANRKSVQLQLAQELGFVIPQTIVTNRPADALDFVRAKDRSVIYKTLTAPVSTFGETRRFSADLEEHIDSIAYAPIILQEEVIKKRDVRVSVIGDEMFATWIEVRNETGRKYPDWRLDVTAKTYPYTLPDDVVRRIKAMMTRLSLSYAAWDFIEDVHGRLVFLELNPTGQFLFNEVDTGQPLAAAFARLLLGSVSRDLAASTACGREETAAC